MSNVLQQAILDNIPDQAWLKDAESRYIQVNDAFMTACGLTAEQILGKTPSDVWPTDWGGRYVDTDMAVIASGQRMRYEEQRFSAAGEVRWFDTIKAPVFDEQGKVVGTAGISREITDRKHAEQELRESRAQLRELSAYLQSVREEERTRIARELHDELGQTLTAIQLGLGALDNAVRNGGDAEAMRSGLSGLVALADNASRSVQRLATDLRPPILDGLGLGAALEWQTEAFVERTGITCELVLPQPPVQPGGEIETAVFRIMQEALTNVARHAEATRAEVTLHLDGDRLILRVVDNGKGMLLSSTAPRRLGIVGMRERAYMLGGELRLQSSPGHGTQIEVSLPLQSGDNTGEEQKGA
ncbi:MAG: PAS domain-containing protein [Rhodocyclaceae bacterium]|nr:PAS domain-containing protein [Rhodocyclaceae bacterium]